MSAQPELGRTRKAAVTAAQTAGDPAQVAASAAPVTPHAAQVTAITPAPPAWLPTELASTAFTAATAKSLGMPGYRWRARQLTQPTRSVRSLAPVSSLEERARAFAKALPNDAAFSHTTAAALWRLPLPARLESPAELDVMRVSNRGWVRRTGCSGHRGLETRQVQTLRGLPVVGLADTWVDLGELPRAALTIDDLICLGDAVVARLAHPDEGTDEWWAYVGQEWSGHQVDEEARGIRLLHEALERRSRPRGARVLREALRQVRPRVRSPQETRWRLVMVRAGLPEPLLNEPVRVGGTFILEGDFVWPAQKVIGEYQGKDHASIRRRSQDEGRRALAEDDGWTMIEVYAEDVTQPLRRARCVRRFATALGLSVEMT